MSHIIGIDIGATKTILVLLDKLKVVKKLKFATPKNKKGLIAVIVKNIKYLADFKSIKGMGLAVTGPLNVKRNLMVNPPNQKFLRNCPLARIVQKITGIPSLMDNDVNCFTLGEALLGAGKQAKSVLGITLGTGVGAGVVINKKLYRGNFGSAGEVGHMVIKFDGFKCSCGSTGCFEEYGSGKFFKRKGVDPRELAKAARKGNKKALNIFREYGRYVGIGLSGAINLLDPEMIVLGGGIANTYSLFMQEAKKEMKKRIISPIAGKNVKIKRTKLGEPAAAIGAALLFHKI